jgi:hypothetical protein
MLKWKLDSVRLEIVLILMQDRCSIHVEKVLVSVQDRCTVRAKRNIGLEIVFDTPNDTPR